jgi:hypothetical protein
MRFVEVVFSAIRADDKAEALADIENLIFPSIIF